MTQRKLNVLVHHLQQLTAARNGSGLPDAELLDRYVRYRDEAAFELLLWRHGALVLNVCRRLLPREEDAEDAFQATFLTFVRKAHAITCRASVASWLYKVAYRAALEARTRARKIAAREKPGGDVQAVQSPADPFWNELRPVLDEELSRLPERLRRVVVLCYLEGKTNEEAARELGCPPGTVFSRLSRGREMLRHRLVRRGVSLSAAALGTALSERVGEAIPTAILLTTTLRLALLYTGGRAAGGCISAQVTALTEGVLRSMFLTKLKMAALVIFVLGLLTAGGVLTRDALNAAPPPKGPLDEQLAQPVIARRAEDNKPVVQVVQPTPGGFERAITRAGSVRPSAQQQVFAAVSGYLKRQPVDIGDRVKKGDVLAEIDAPLVLMEGKQAAAAVQFAKGQYEEAKARLATAEAELKATASRIRYYEAKVKSDKAHYKFRQAQAERFQELLKQRSIDARLAEEQENGREAAFEALNASQEALNSAQADAEIKRSMVESAKAALVTPKAKLLMAQLDLEKAQIQVGFTRIVSAYEGIVTQRNYDVGDYIAASDRTARRPLMTVQRTDRVRVVVQAYEGDVPSIRPGSPVDLASDALPGVKIRGEKVSRIGFSLDPQTRTMPAEIDVPNPKDLLRPGMSMKVVLHLDGPPNAFRVPKSCLLSNKGQPSVYVVRDGKAHLTPVELGGFDTETMTEIASGLQATDRIVRDPKGLSGDVIPIEVKKAP